MSPGLVSENSKRGTKLLNNSIQIEDLAGKLVEDQIELIKLLIQGNSNHPTSNSLLI